LVTLSAKYIPKPYKGEPTSAPGFFHVAPVPDSDSRKFVAEMPWHAVRFNSSRRQSLSGQFKVNGIPSFIILNADGEVITKDGRSAVMKDPTGEKYPWTPPTAAEKGKLVLDSLGADLVAKANGKPIGLYFSAHWCPPCRNFTPKLADWYKSGLKDNMEIVFVSSDRDEAAFDEYFNEMPWLALPYAKRDEKATLSDLCGVEGIPTLAVINPDGTIVTTDGTSKIAADPKAEHDPAAVAKESMEGLCFLGPPPLQFREVHPGHAVQPKSVRLSKGASFL